MTESVAPMLELRDASVVRGGTVVLDAMNVSIAVGEHTAILGPNGAGKSSLLRLLTLQDRPRILADGRPPILLFGRDRWDVSELRAQMGVVSSDLHDTFVRGNLSGALKAREVVLSGHFGSIGVFGYQEPTGAMAQRAFAALDAVGAGHLADRWMEQLSTGEARRVLIARALVNEPTALVLDEPTRGLDLVARHEFLEQVRRIAARGTTILLVTHHIEEIIPEIGRVIFLSDGRIVDDGPKASVLTGSRLTRLFGRPVALDESDGYYYPRLPSRSGADRLRAEATR